MTVGTGDLARPDPLAAARRWLADDPDPVTRDALLAELADAAAGDVDAMADLRHRFTERLQFGTAGLRGPLGPGPRAMNQVTVRRAAAGYARFLLDTVPSARDRGVVVGFDARRQSDVFARDSAAIFAGVGLRVFLIERPLPTPVTAFAITELGACGGVMVTASHNPPADNGYKVYLDDGSQIVPPTDAAIAAAIDAVGPLSEVLMADGESALVERVADRVLDAYVAHVAASRFGVDDEGAGAPHLPAVTVAYTAMHGVGADVLDAVFARARLAPVEHVAQQRAPDATFPTVGFPNPEEPGAMDLVIDLATRVGADIVLANDPDADRLGVAIPVPTGGFRRLAGDEIGWLLADHILSHTAGDDRLVVSTLVSSTLLAAMAASAGVLHVETPTGFKWIADAIRRHPERRMVFGYEQALGYLVGDRPRDKDGISAAVALVDIAAAARRDGVSIQDRLDAIATRFGRHRTAETSVRLDPNAAAEAVERLFATPPSSVAGVGVVAVSEPIPGLVRFDLAGGSRVQVRRSGTEPKVKIYAESVSDIDPAILANALQPHLTSAN